MCNMSRGSWIGRAFSAAVLLLAMAALPPTLRAQPAGTTCQPVGGPAYLGSHDPARTSVIVFVHGVLSSATGAWSRDATHSWPCLLRDETIFDNSNIYLYGYDTNLLGASPSIDKVAKQLLKDLQADKVLSHAHITIVAHSMGGLIASRMLLQMQMQSTPAYQDQLQRIRLVQFYGTPAAGAEIAWLAKQVFGDGQIAEMPPSDQLQAFIAQWESVAWPFAWYCMAEGKGIGFMGIGGLVVPRDSATALCRKRTTGIEDLEQFDHSTMVKPVSLRDTPHRTFRRSFISCASGAVASTAPLSEAGTRRGQLTLQMLTRLRNGLSDDSPTGRIAALSAVQAELYVSDSWGEAYLMPASPAKPSLARTAFESLGGRPFAVEFLKLFQDRPAELTPAWVGRADALHRYAGDGQLVELHRGWVSAGRIGDDDAVVALTPRNDGSQAFLLVGTQARTSGEEQARMRGLLIVPPSPRICD